MKYIVYCTTNLINNKIYIGVHQTKNPDHFDGYIGNGIYVTQPSTYNKPKTKYQYAVKKYGPKNFKRITLQVFDNEDDAYLVEELIVNKKFLQRTDVYNMILGGKTGLEESTSKPCYQYDLNGNFVASYASQQKAAIAVNRGFSTIKHAIHEKYKCAGYFWTEFKVDKLDVTQYDKSNKIVVYQYDKNGQYDCCYESIADASRCNRTSTSNIIRSIKLGYLVNNKHFSTQFYAQYSNARLKQIKITKVYQYDLKGNFLAEYASQADACRAIGKHLQINVAIKMGKTCGGFQWNYEKLNKMPDISKNTSGKARRVGQYDLQGNLIHIFKTVTECKKQFSGCSNVLHGKYHTSGGYIFKYMDEIS